MTACRWSFVVVVAIVLLAAADHPHHHRVVVVSAQQLDKNPLATGSGKDDELPWATEIKKDKRTMPGPVWFDDDKFRDDDLVESDDKFPTPYQGYDKGYDQAYYQGYDQGYHQGYSQCYGSTGGGYNQGPYYQGPYNGGYGSSTGSRKGKGKSSKSGYTPPPGIGTFPPGYVPPGYTPGKPGLPPGYMPPGYTPGKPFPPPGFPDYDGLLSQIQNLQSQIDNIARCVEVTLGFDDGPATCTIGSIVDRVEISPFRSVRIETDFITLQSNVDTMGVEGADAPIALVAFDAEVDIFSQNGLSTF